VHQGYDLDRFVLCTDEVVLQCQCGEQLILLGREADWYSEGRNTFDCGGCGRSNPLTDRLEDPEPSALHGAPHEEAEGISALLRSLKPPFGRG
jgi:hypothetical protein